MINNRLINKGLSTSEGLRGLIREILKEALEALKGFNQREVKNFEQGMRGSIKKEKLKSQNEEMRETEGG